MLLPWKLELLAWKLATYMEVGGSFHGSRWKYIEALMEADEAAE